MSVRSLHGSPGVPVEGKWHAGDWLFVIAGDRMVAMTHEAYAEAWKLGFGEAPDAFEVLRAKGGGVGSYLVAALRVLEDDGTVRVEQRDTMGHGEYRWPVYVFVPPADRVSPPRAPAAKRRRAKRPVAVERFPLVLIEGGGRR